MNRPIVRLYGLVVLLFALLVAFTSRWTIFEASSLRNNSLNKRAVLEQQHIDRGPIVAADGTVLAHSTRRAEDVYERSYPTGSLFANVIGYYFTNLGSTGVERFRSSALNGQTGNGVQAILDQLQGQEAAGRQGRHLAGPEGAARRAGSARRTPGSGRRAGTAQRRGDGDVLVARASTPTS